MLEGFRWIPVCPEQYAGLPTPRLPMAFVGGTGQEALGGAARIIQQDGRDVTGSILEASRALTRVGIYWGIRYAVLKERSPSCGVVSTYLEENCVQGMGVFAAVLTMSGVRVYSEETIKWGELS